MKLTFLSIAPEKHRLVTHTDYSSKDQDGIGRTQGGYITGATDPSMRAGEMAPWSPLVWKSHKLEQGCTSTLAGEAKSLSSGLGHLEWIMCLFADVLFPACCLENREKYSQRFSAISVIDCKSVFDFVTKPGAPTGIDDRRCAIYTAIIRGCLRRMGVTLRWGPTILMLGDSLTKDRADAADLLRACVRASTYQLADESSTLQRA